MTAEYSFDENQTELMKRCALPILLVLTALAIGISILALASGYVTVFQNLFYFPILVASISCPRKGLYFTTACSALYFILIVPVFGYYNEIAAALIRVFFFELVAVVVGYLSWKRQKAENALKEQLTNLNDIVQRQTEYIKMELDDARRLETAYRSETGYHEKIIDGAAVAILNWNPEGYIIKANPAVCDFLRIRESELLGRRITAILPLDESGLTTYPTYVETDIHTTGGQIAKALWVISRIEETAGEENPMVYMAIGVALPSRVLLEESLSGHR